MYEVGYYVIDVLEPEKFLDPWEYIEGTLYCDGREYIFDGWYHMGTGTVGNKYRCLEYLHDAEQVNKFLHA